MCESIKDVIDTILSGEMIEYYSTDYPDTNAWVEDSKTRRR